MSEVEKLRAANRKLRKGLLEEVHKVQALELAVAASGARVLELLRQLGSTR